jgi:PleD family two-component response regulator
MESEYLHMTNRVQPVLIVRNSSLHDGTGTATMKRTNSPIVTASGCYEAVQAAEYISPQFIVLDITEPGPTGLEILRILRLTPRTASIPVIIVSSLPEKQSIPLLDEGAAAFCHRSSITPEVLGATVNNALRNARTLQNRADHCIAQCSVELATEILSATGPNLRNVPGDKASQRGFFSLGRS